MGTIVWLQALDHKASLPKAKTSVSRGKGSRLRFSLDAFLFISFFLIQIWKHEQYLKSAAKRHSARTNSLFVSNGEWLPSTPLWRSRRLLNYVSTLSYFSPGQTKAVQILQQVFAVPFNIGSLEMCGIKPAWILTYYWENVAAGLSGDSSNNSVVARQSEHNLTSL